MGDPPTLPEADYSHLHHRCPKCRQVVADDGYCPDCDLKKLTYTVLGVVGFLLVGMSLFSALPPIIGSVTVTALYNIGVSACVVVAVVGIVLYESRKRASEKRFPQVTANRKLEWQARTAVRAYEMTSPPVVLGKKQCPTCGNPLDDTDWCWKCAKKRQSRTTLMLMTIPAIGFGACVGGTFAQGLPAWMSSLPVVGMVLMGVGSLVALVHGIVTASKIDKRRRGG